MSQDKYQEEFVGVMGDDTPKKPIGDLHSVPHYRCPNCFCTVQLFKDSERFEKCPRCNQAIKWRKR